MPDTNRNEFALATDQPMPRRWRLLFLLGSCWMLLSIVAICVGIVVVMQPGQTPLKDFIMPRGTIYALVSAVIGFVVSRFAKLMVWWQRK